MLNVIYTEFYKLKNSKILWSVPISFLVPNLLIFFMYAFNPKYPIVLWESYVNNTGMLINLLIGTGLFALMTGFVFSREYQEKMIDTLFTYPISRTKFFIAKLLVMLVIIFITFMSSFFLSIATGFIIKHEPLTWSFFLTYLIAYLNMTVMHSLLVPITAQLAIKSKHIIPPIILGVSAMMMNLIVINTQLNTLFPWTIPTILSPHEHVGRSFTNYPFGIFCLLLTFIIGVILSLRYIKRDI